MYTIARSVALAAISGACFAARSAQGMEAAAIAMVFVQADDALIGVTTRNVMKTSGPAGMALANAATLVWFLILP